MNEEIINKLKAIERELSVWTIDNMARANKKDKEFQNIQYARNHLGLCLDWLVKNSKTKGI